MILDMKRVVIELGHQRVLPVKDAAGTRIDCLRGEVWITESGCINDILLAAGQSHVISRGGATLLQGLPEATVGLRAPEARQTFDGFANWLQAKVIRLSLQPN